jgi:2-iminobutanoate/2-iminopropanoate deaminase
MEEYWSMQKQIIATDKAPRAIGAYSQAILAAGERLLFVSGQVGFDPQTMEIVPGGVGPEAEQVMKNIAAIVGEAGGDLGAIVKATIYLADIDDFAAVNEVYASHFAADPPARAAFAVAALPKGARVEIEAIAVL